MFNPKLPTVRAMRTTAAIFFLILGVILARNGEIRGSWCLIGVAIGVVIGLLPESSPAKQKPQPEKYHLTGGQP
jgi:hypothetical protein